jgi:hypothetical protein
MDDTSPEAEQAYYDGDEITKLVEEVRGVGGVVAGVKVLVAVCGTVPFQGGGGQGGFDDRGGEEEHARGKGYRESLAKGAVKAESVHLIGDGDPWRGESEKLVEFFGEKRRVIRFSGGHHMPADDAVNRQVARIIMAACRRM